MAEVPEVETIVRDLRQAVVGRTILSTDVRNPAAVRFPPVEEFRALLAGRAVLESRRRAKYILLPLSGDVLLAVHFALWGTLVLVPSGEVQLPETMIVWRLDQDQDLRLLDRLGYARAAAGAPDVLAAGLDLASLGPEALDPDFTVDTLARQLAPRRGVLKSVLLNQRVLAGLGNRDADESLWLAGIDPRRVAASLSQDETARLYEAIGTMLQEGIAMRGTQRDLFGVRGRASHSRHIFERARQPCPRCGTPVAHLRIGGRNTYYCPGCQA